MAEIEPSKEIDGVYLAHLESVADARGRFVETYRDGWISGAPKMVQGNRSDSKAGVLRGMHYHLKQSDFWYVPSGRVLTALFDFRAISATYRRVHMIEMGDRNDVAVGRVDAWFQC